MKQYTITARYDDGDKFLDTTFRLFANSETEAKSIAKDIHPHADYILVTPC